MLSTIFDFELNARQVRFLFILNNYIMKIDLLRFPVESFRRIENPYDDTDDDTVGTRNYLTVVNVKNLPKELRDWREINVRDAKLSSNVSKGIRETLENAPDSFFFKNRGMTLIVSKVQYDQRSKNVELKLVDKECEGLLDGGHTFSVIQKYLEEKENPADAFVRVEILEGFTDKHEIVSIVEARNKSTQVQEQGIQELLGTFQSIKTAVKGQLYEGHIAYKEYELGEEGDRKTIDIKDILSYLLCFYTDEFGNSDHPTRAYGQKTAILRQYAKDMGEGGDKKFEKFIGLLPDILRLHDAINEEFRDVYNKNNRKFGSLAGIKDQAKVRKPVTLDFTGKEVDYRLPSAYIYPILAAFRAVIKCENQKCAWKTNPITLFHKLKDGLISRLAEQALHHKNPDKTAKDTTTWRGCYDLVRMEILEREL